MRRRFAMSMLIVCGTVLVAFGQNGNETAVDRNLRGRGRVNASTLAMEFELPLGSYPGRGINVPISLSYSSKQWRMTYLGENPNPGSSGFPCFPHYLPWFAEKSASGWTTSLAVPYIEYVGANNRYNHDGTPVNYNEITCPTEGGGGGSYPHSYVRRLLVHLPSGETHEVRPDDTVISFTANGTPFEGPQNPLNWNATYYAVDGSNIKYIQNSSTNTYRLSMPDGSFYDFDSTTSHPADRKAVRFTDRNGNFTTYQNGTWTDTLGRTLAAPIGLSAPAPTTAGNPHVYSMPGMTGTYKFHWKRLNGGTQAESALTDIRHPDYQLRYLGNIYICQSTSPPYAYMYCSRPAETYLFGEGEGAKIISHELFNPVVLTEIELPTGQKYKFTYDIYGRIEKIIYPTGGEEVFQYAIVPTLSTLEFGDLSYQTNFGVINRKVYKFAGDQSPYEWTYTAGHVAPHGYVATITNSDGTKTERFLHRGMDAGSGVGTFGYDNVLAAMPYEERSFDSAGVLISRKLTHWTKTENGGYRDWHPRVAREDTIVYDSGGDGLSATAIYEYEGDLNQRETPVLVRKTTQYAYETVSDGSSFNLMDPPCNPEDPDCGPPPTPTPSPAPLPTPSSPKVKVVETDYLDDADYKARGIIGLPSETRILNPANLSDVLAKSQFVYDEALYFDNSYTTTNWVDPGSNLRGNVTTTRTLNKDTNTWIESRTMFDNFGNVRKVWDTSGDSTRFVETEYDSVYKYAYPTKTKAPAPDPTGVHGTTEGSEITRIYDFTTGLLTSVTDANGQTAFTEYDNVLRPKRIIPPAGGSISEIIYNDTPDDIWVKRRQQIDENNWVESTTYFDNLGRAYKSRTKDLQGDVMSRVIFDSFGRVEKTSNPYRVDAQGNPTETVYWSKLRYDEANRVVETYAPAPEGQTGQSLGTVQFGISDLPGLIGTYTVAIDASGRKSRAISGIYGLMRVDEATGKGGAIDQDLGTLANPTQPTFYSYNIKGEMVKITQGNPNQPSLPIQHRYFMYDSLGRLIRVRQPEQTPNPNLATTGNPENNQWTAGFTYDVFGHVIRFTDAKGINVVNEYDLAGRATSRCYTKPNIQTTATRCNQLSNSEVSLDTSQVDYHYDGNGLGLPQAPQFSKGALTKVTNGISQHLYSSFDNHGRLLASQQITDGQIYNFGYKYNLSGGLTEETYPSGRIVKNVLDSDGGLSAVSTKAPAGSFKTVAANFDYSPTGAVRKMMLGNGRWETASFNERFQLTQLGLGSSPTDKSIWKVDYEYGELSDDGTTVLTTQNRGSIARQTTTIPTISFTQTYRYDSLNRLTEARETASDGTQNWKQTFGYDRFGNRTSRYQKVGDVVLPIDNHTLPTIDPTNNRFATGQGYVYDFNGNLIQDAEGRTFTFDANDKQIQVTNASQQVVGAYFYDGSGARIKKVTESETTIFVYDASGRLAAEYSSLQNPDAGTSYLTNDHLGSPRVITDRAGGVSSRRDFMPFGEEIYSGTGGRTESLKYSDIGLDNIRKRFTGYEKDVETDLDYAQARMYHNGHGRFTAVDPLMASAFPLNPQTFNRYTYTGNNPVNYTDPSGLLYYRNRSTGSIEWFDKDPGGDWKDYTDQRVTITQGGCFATDRCVVEGDDVTLNSDGSLTYHNRNAGAAIVNIGAAVEQTFLETTNNIGDLLSIEFSSAPTADAPTIDIPIGGPGGGPLEGPVGGGADPGAEVGAGSSGDWQVDAAKLLYFLGQAWWNTSGGLEEDCGCNDDGGEEEIELYRGVSSAAESDPDYMHERFRLATLGIAIPRGGPATPEEHNNGDTDSIYTSWTTNEQFAEGEAKYPFRGVVLTKKISGIPAGSKP